VPFFALCGLGSDLVAIRWPMAPNGQQFFFLLVIDKNGTWWPSGAFFPFY
jgi:hypothetical protein